MFYIQTKELSNQHGQRPAWLCPNHKELKGEMTTDEGANISVFCKDLSKFQIFSSCELAVTGWPLRVFVRCSGSQTDRTFTRQTQAGSTICESHGAAITSTYHLSIELNLVKWGASKYVLPYSLASLICKQKQHLISSHKKGRLLSKMKSNPKSTL